METITSAPGKIILFGEHAVVYGRPAIAVPLTQVQATARVGDGRPGQGVRLVAPDLGQDWLLEEAQELDALADAVRRVQAAAGLERLPDLTVTVNSTIPIAGGLGSGAAIAAATIRALARHLHRPDLATNEQVARLAYEVEKIHHGTPSGIDNTVVTYERPVYFVRGAERNHIETFVPGRTVRLLVGDTGVRSSTRLVVGDVRQQWQAQPERFERLFTACGRLAEAARQTLEAGELAQLGQLMQENHAVLQEMSVSSAGLDALVSAALAAGALGAKLSGAGRGGNMIALVTEGTAAQVQAGLLAAGARAVLQTVLPAGNEVPA